MGEINSIDELKNCSVILKIAGCEYNAKIVKRKKQYALKIDIIDNLKDWRALDREFPVITGKTTFDNIELSFINCFSIGWENSSNPSEGTVKKAYHSLFFERILVGYRLDDINNVCIKEVSAEYTHVSDFFRYLPYEDNLENIELKFDQKSYTSCSPTHKMVFAPSVSHAEKSVIIKPIITATIVQETDFNTGIQSIYKFSNLLMIFNKQYDEPMNIEVLCDDDKTHVVIDCISPNTNLKENVFPYRGIKFQHIKDFGLVINRFLEIENQLNPALELYYQSISSDCTSLMRFLNAINMVEYFSNEFDKENSETVKRKRNPERDAPTLANKIESLFKNVNVLYDFDEPQILKLATRIKKGRTYYVHYVKNSIKLNDRELLIYHCLLEDVILFNVYLQLRIDLQYFVDEKIPLKCGTYSIDELLSFIKE